MSIPRLFADHFKQFLFISVGVIDSSRFKGVDEVEHLKQTTEECLKKYVAFVQAQGLRADYRFKLGTETIDLLVDLCLQTGKEFPKAVFFSGKLIFAEETFLTRLLHNQAALTLQRRLQFAGLQSVVLPIRAL